MSRASLSFALVLALGLAAASAETPAAPAAAPEAKEKESALARFEIIAVGSFPVSLFASNFGFDLGTYLVAGFDPTYAPWPFSSDRRPSLSTGERIWRISSAVGLSLGIAALDALLLPRARARRAAARGLGNAKASEAPSTAPDLIPPGASGTPLPPPGSSGTNKTGELDSTKAGD